MDSNALNLPERLTARDVLRRLSGVNRVTLTRWMRADEVLKRGFTRPFPAGEGAIGLAKTWSRDDVELWIKENAPAINLRSLDAATKFASLSLGRALQAVEKATEGGTTSEQLRIKIERLISGGLANDEKLKKSLKGIKIKGDDIEFEFNPNNESSFVYFLLTYG